MKTKALLGLSVFLFNGIALATPQLPITAAVPQSQSVWQPANDTNGFDSLLPKHSLTLDSELSLKPTTHFKLDLGELDDSNQNSLATAEVEIKSLNYVNWNRVLTIALVTLIAFSFIAGGLLVFRRTNQPF
jgi:hypothetical protein